MHSNNKWTHAWHYKNHIYMQLLPCGNSGTHKLIHPRTTAAQHYFYFNRIVWLYNLTTNSHNKMLVNSSHIDAFFYLTDLHFPHSLSMPSVCLFQLILMNCTLSNINGCQHLLLTYFQHLPICSYMHAIKLEWTFSIRLIITMVKILQ